MPNMKKNNNSSSKVTEESKELNEKHYDEKWRTY